MKPADALTIKIANDDGSDYSFYKNKSARLKSLSFIPMKEGNTFTIYSRHPKGPLEISIHSKNLDKGVRIKPVSPEFWNTFSRTGLQGFEIRWRGGR